MARLLHDWLTGYLEYTDNTEPPLMYRAWVGLSTIAAAMERKCCVEMGFLRFYPNMYVVLVGPSGKCRKGVAMTPGLILLEELGLGDHVIADSITTAQLIVRLASVSQTTINEETKEIITHSSITVFSKELAVFLGDYNEEFIMTLVDWYDCKDRWKRETKNSGTYEIDGVWVNLIGATTPKLLREKLNTAALGGGLTSRMIFVTEFDRDKNISYPTLSDEERKLGKRLVADLNQIHRMMGYFVLTPEYLDYYEDWYQSAKDNPPFKDDRFADYFERRPNHLVKLSMILNASRTDSMVLEVEDLARAVEVLRATERNMPNTFSGVGKNEMADVIDRMVRLLVVRGTKVSKRELVRIFYHDASVTAIEEVMRTLEAMGHATLSYEGSETFIELKPGGKHAS
jgi:hypothetical protein